VFLYDHFDRLKTPHPRSLHLKQNHLKDLFVFKEGEEEELRKYKYVKFFEALA